MEARGEARRLADVFAPQDVERASTLVQSAVDAHRQTLCTLETFLRDNQELTKLVQDLPKKISHGIMVPFGKAAFFPGRLMHTNELLVLLGEGYYAECTATQTLEILGRRGSFLGTQITGVKQQLADLDVESRFFKETLAEATAGFVEIRENFVEPSPSQIPGVEFSVSTENDEAGGKAEVGSRVEDEEHQRLMARLEELEAAEAAAEFDEGGKPQEDSHDSDLAQQDVIGLVKQDPLELPIQCQEHAGDRPTHSQASVPSSRGAVGGQVRQDDAVASHRRAIKVRPDVRSPADLLKFEEWRRSNFEQGSTEQVSEQVRKKTSVSPLPETRECVKAGPSASQELPSSELPRSADRLRRESQAFTGRVLERSGPPTFSMMEEQLQGPKQDEKRPTSKFKLRQRER